MGIFSVDYYLCVRYGLSNGPFVGSDFTARHGGLVNEMRFGKVMENRSCPMNLNEDITKC